MNKPENSSTSQSLNSLIKVLQPKKKNISNNYNYVGNNNKYLKKK